MDLTLWVGDCVPGELSSLWTSRCMLSLPCSSGPPSLPEALGSWYSYRLENKNKRSANTSENPGLAERDTDNTCPGGSDSNRETSLIPDGQSVRVL